MNLNLKNKYIHYFLIYLLPFISTGFISWLRISFDVYLYPSPFLLFELLVLLHSLIGGFYSGIITSVLTSIVGNYFFMQPYGELKYDEFPSVTLTILYFIQSVIVVLIISQFVEKEKKYQEINSVMNSQQDKFKYVLNNAYTIIVIVDTEGRILEANNTFLELMGDNADQVIGSKIVETMPWAYNSTVNQRLINALDQTNTNLPTKYEDLIRLEDDRLMDVEINIVAIDKDQDGKMDYKIINVVDITARKNYEAELERKDKLFSKLIDSNIIGMIIADKEGNIWEANDAFLEMLGFSVDEFENEGLSWRSISPEESLDQDEVELKKMAETGYFGPYQKYYFHKDRHKVFVMLSGVLLSKKKGTFLCIVVNLTYQKDIERKKDEFINIISHELKTPMTILKGYLQILNKKLGVDSDYKGFLKIINHELDKLNLLINELHDIVKIESRKFNINKEKINIVKLVKNSIKQIEPFIDKQLVSLITDHEDIQIEADPTRIEQVMLNLLTNAVKYSPGESRIKIYIKKSEKEVEVSVKDFGKGIPKEKQKKIFSKFFQVEKNSEGIEGLGLGLYITSQIIKSHQGSIGVKSELKKGSTFYFTLPLAV